MKVAVMQPYFFPYFGYFQLINTVDYFVIFDDVNYIKRGWINKNRILQNGEISNITLPVQNASQNRKINQHNRIIDTKALGKLKKQIKFAYAKAPNFKEVYPLLEIIIEHPETNLSKYITNSLTTVSKYLGLKTQFIYASELSNNDDWNNAEKRIINITKQLGGTHYLNLPGGESLYNKATFNAQSLSLEFIKPVFEPYLQIKVAEFQQGLSIIDLLMCKGR